MYQYHSHASTHMACSVKNDRLRTLRSTASAPSISSHRYGFFVFLDVGEVGEGALQLPAVDRLRRLAGVLEGDTQVGTASARGLAGFDVCGCVADLRGARWLALRRCTGRRTAQYEDLLECLHCTMIDTYHLDGCGAMASLLSRSSRRR